MWRNSATVMVEQWKSNCRTVSLNSGTVMVEQGNNDGGTMGQSWWEPSGGTEEQWNSDAKTVEQ